MKPKLPGYRRINHELRARVENVPKDELRREEVLTRRREMVREENQEDPKERLRAWGQ